MEEYSKYYLPAHEQFVSCPYNKAHRVLQHRLANHMVRCRRSHVNAGCKECRFNTSHLMPEAEIKQHEAICPDRLTIELYMLTDSRDKKRHEPKGSTSSQKAMKENDSEDWDDLPHPTYDPTEKNKQMDIMRNVQHGTPSERKKLRAEENLRLMQIREGN